MVRRLIQRIKRSLSYFFIGEKATVKPAIFSASEIKLDPNYIDITHDRDTIALSHFVDFKPIDLSGWSNDS